MFLGILSHLNDMGCIFIFLDAQGIFIILKVLSVFWSFQRFQGIFGHSRGFKVYFVHFRGLEIFWLFQRFHGYFCQFSKFGLVWSFSRFQGIFGHSNGSTCILVILVFSFLGVGGWLFQRLKGYFVNFRDFEGIWVILEYQGILVISDVFGYFWSFQRPYFNYQYILITTRTHTQTHTHIYIGLVNGCSQST